MALRKVVQQLKFGRVSYKVIDTCVLTLMVQNGLRTADALLEMSAPEEKTPLGAEVAESVDMAAVRRWRRGMVGSGRGGGWDLDSRWVERKSALKPSRE
jgi:hypothetical protein